MPLRDKESGLTERELLFCQQYLVLFNASKAAKSAGYSANSAGDIGHELLKRPKIQAFLSRQVKKTADKLEITRERILEEYRRIAFADVRDVAEVTEEGVYFYASDDWTDDIASSVSEISCTKSRVHGTRKGQPGCTNINIKVKHHDKLRALEKLGEYMKMWKGDSSGEVVFNLNYSPKDK